MSKKRSLKKVKINNKVQEELEEKMSIRCKNEEQKNALEIIENNTITFLSGIAGSGKTHMAVCYAAREFLKGTYYKIILCRPAVEACNEKLGHLPGEIISKIQPYMIPLFDILESRLGRFFVSSRLEDGTLEILPMGFCRGLTFKDSIVILDESQNATKEQLLMFLTRLGENSKIILTYDALQSDLNGKNKVQVVADTLSSRVPGIAKFEFKESVRHPMIQQIISAFTEIK